MKNIILIILIVNCLSAFSQGENYRDNVEIFDGYVIEFSTYPSVFLRNNKAKYFSKKEFRNIVNQKGSFFKIEIDVKEKKIKSIKFEKETVQRHHPVILPNDLIKKLESVLEDHISILSIKDLLPDREDKEEVIFRWVSGS